MTIQQGCEVLCINRAGYYAAKRRHNQPKKPCVIRVILKSVFEISGRTYGSRRLRIQLNHQGVRIGIHRVRSLMKDMQIKSIWKPKLVETAQPNFISLTIS